MILPNMDGLDGTSMAVEFDRLRAGEAWCETEIAGLQYHDYYRDGLDGQPVRPREGDRLQIVRAPENPYDPRACEVWWRNDVRLGHLPRGVARLVAGPLDEGLALRAYVASGGDGEAWSARALLVGPAAQALHESHIAHVIRQDFAEWEWEQVLAEKKREAPGRANGARFEKRLRDVRAARLVQATNTFLAHVPVEGEITLPPVGETVELFAIEKSLGCSRSTAFRLARRAGVKPRSRMRGWYCTGTDVTVTPELHEAMAAWAARPRTRVTKDHVSCR
ncbi:HIRAN domain-containing protein [Methylobacterium iners]|uniref:HIRAN domain-containing protein n=1 Tax=Methylobacterium iners TaxID=418707 RepID=A0ABQ4S4K8_9HYPH|nr:HIRAN domain-containing protein [Methylobacterium iners]GJD97495.1 hypothetical protein OCOJLMKI_4726 [Methylobacterium iners]